MGGKRDYSIREVRKKQIQLELAVTLPLKLIKANKTTNNLRNQSILMRITTH